MPETMVAALVVMVCVPGDAVWAGSGGRLFPEELPERQWTQFQAAGFSQPVPGLIFRSGKPTCCGVALGGLGTGCIDVLPTGAYGFSTFFPAAGRQSHNMLPWYRNAQLLTPFLGIAVGGRTWVLSTKQHIEGGTLQGCAEPGNAIERALKDDPKWRAHWQNTVPASTAVKAVSQISYWGHYPIADLVYDFDAPIGVELRAWSPFIPGDASSSNIPGAVFEVRLRNTTDKVQVATLGFSFPGMYRTEPSFDTFVRKEIQGAFHGMTVSSPGGEMSYALGVIGPEDVRFGAGLKTTADAWSKIATQLPAVAPGESSSSLAVHFKLAAEATKTVRIILAWYVPGWTGAGYKDIIGFDAMPPGPWEMPGWEKPWKDAETGRRYRAMYGSRYHSAAAVAQHLASDHATLLGRILAWQEVLLTARELPPWLRDCLLNSFNLYAKDSCWARPAPNLGNWSYPDGAFGMNECPRSCSIIGCIASNFYGDMPTLYFFPELEAMIMRNYRALMRPDGAVPFLYPTGEFTQPAYEWQLGLNCSCYVDLVGRLWYRTGDGDILREFYPSVKKVTTLAMTMNPGSGLAGEGVLRLPRDGRGQEWWEHTELYGLVTHFGGMRLSTLRIAQRMAETIGDEDFAKQCATWFRQASKLMEERLWGDGNYLLYEDPIGGRKSALIMSSQLDGQWAALFHGLPGVFPPDRARTALQTIKRTCTADYGFVGFADPLSGPLLKGYGSFSAENHMIAMTYMYLGQRDFGLEMVRRHMDSVVRVQGHGWDLPNMITLDTGERFFGTDYFQNMMLWSLPAALEGKDLRGPCRSRGLVDRMLKAARVESELR